MQSFFVILLTVAKHAFDMRQNVHFIYFAFQGKYSCKSDVWAFAVTLWEILMCGKVRPFEDQSDESVIENMKHYQNNGFYSRLGVFLSQPMNCPKEIYDLMCECWQWREGDRPNFREIHLFLQRKNLGYAPR